MIEKFTVSVVIPTFNRSKMLREAVISVLNQSRPAEEIVVVDDGSEEDISLALAELQGPIKLIRHTKNRGHSASRNTGIEHASGNLVAFLDSDDLWLPEKLEIQIRAFELQPSVGLVGGGFQCINATGELVAEPPLPLEHPKYEDLAIGLFAFSGSSPLAICSKEALEKTGGFDESLPLLEDWDLWIRISEHYAVYNPQKRLAQIRWHNEPRAHRPPGIEWVEMNDKVKRIINSRIKDNRLRRKAQAFTLFQKSQRYATLKQYTFALSPLFKSFLIWPLPILPNKPRVRAIVAQLIGR